MTYTHLTIDELATIYSFWKLHKKAYQVAPALHRSAETVYRIYRFLEAGSTIIDYQWHYRKHKQHCGRKPIQLRPDELAYIQAKTQAGWRTIANQFDLNIHFAAVGAPNQRGLNENTNGLLRRDGLHHNLIMDQLSDELVQVVASRRKHIPRKSLGYQTLLEAFISQITDEQLKNF